MTEELLKRFEKDEELSVEELKEIIKFCEKMELLWKIQKRDK